MKMSIEWLARAESYAFRPIGSELSRSEVGKHGVHVGEHGVHVGEHSVRVNMFP